MGALIHADLTQKVIGACIEVHRELGAGLLESAYEECLCCELSLRDIPYQRQLSLPVTYKGRRLDCGYVVDLIVDQKVLLELKAVEELHPVFDAQLLTYLRLANLRVGLIVNFNVPVLKDGIRRRVL